MAGVGDFDDEDVLESHQPRRGPYLIAQEATSPALGAIDGSPEDYYYEDMDDYSEYPDFPLEWRRQYPYQPPASGHRRGHYPWSPYPPTRTTGLTDITQAGPSNSSRPLMPGSAAVSIPN